MAQPAPLHTVYTGIARDLARDQLPPGYVWNLQDFLPTDQGAPIRKRGGWTYASSSISASSGSLERVMYAQLNAVPQLAAIDSATATSAGNGVWLVNETTGALTSVGSVTAASAGGATGSTRIGDPHLYGEHWFIPVGWVDGSVVESTTSSFATQFDGTNLQKIVSFTGTDNPCGARYSTDFKSRMILGNTYTHPNRVWFSSPGIIDSSDFLDTDAWIDFPKQITGLAALTNAFLVFSADDVIRVRGSTPPPEPDMFVEKLSDYGCVDYRSIATWNSQVIYADTNGVYMTDAINTIDLTEQGLIKTYYRGLLSTYTPGPWTATPGWMIRGAVFRNFYFLVIVNDSNTLVDCLVCDLRRRVWFRLQNFNFRGFVQSSTTRQRFFAASGTVGRVVDVTGIFSPSASNKADADGSAVLPVVEYPMRRGFSRIGRRWAPAGGLTHFKRLYLTYDMRDAASDNPILTLSYVTTPEATSYTSLSYTLAETTAMERVGRSFGPTGARGGITKQEIGVKVAQTNASSETKLYGLEAEYQTVEGSVLEQ